MFLFEASFVKYFSTDSDSYILLLLIFLFLRLSEPPSLFSEVAGCSRRGLFSLILPQAEGAKLCHRDKYILVHFSTQGKGYRVSITERGPQLRTLS